MFQTAEANREGNILEVRLTIVNITPNYVSLKMECVLLYLLYEFDIFREQKLLNLFRSELCRLNETGPGILDELIEY